jgi:hypothetical protein
VQLHRHDARPCPQQRHGQRTVTRAHVDDQVTG